MTNNLMSPPTISLDLTGMRHHVKMMLSEHITRIQSEAEQAIDNAIDSFDFQSVVDEVIHEELEKALRAALPSIFAAAFELSGVRSIVNEAVKKSLLKVDMAEIIEEEL